jgi:hypothetical protein
MKMKNEKRKTVSPVMKPVTGEIEKITGVDFEEIGMETVKSNLQRVS